MTYNPDSKVDVFVNNTYVCTTKLDSRRPNCKRLVQGIRALKWLWAVNPDMPAVFVCDYETVRIRYHKEA